MAARVKLSPADVERIRTLFLRGEMTRKELAYEFKVSQPYISRIVLGRRRVS